MDPNLVDPEKSLSGTYVWGLEGARRLQGRNRVPDARKVAQKTAPKSSEKLVGEQVAEGVVLVGTGDHACEVGQRAHRATAVVEGPRKTSRAGSCVWNILVAL